MSIEQIEQQFRAFWRERVRVDAGRTLVAAVSGGGDSCALLALLCETAVAQREQIVAAYFDHGLRGDDAAREERRAVAEVCDRYGVRLESDAWDAPVAREASARQARYAFLSDAARRHGASALVTGHTSDDQVETVLMHALRGAGLYGLAGMAVTSPWPFASQGGPALVRPLLAVSRAETHAYCDERGIAYVDDASNLDAAYLRNRVRRDLVPVIDAVAPEGRRMILRLADEARAGFEAIAPIVDALVIDDGDGHVRVSCAALRTLAPELRPHVFRRAVVRLLGDAREFGAKHFAILSRAHNARAGSVFELPRGVVVTVDPDAVVLSIGALASGPIDPAVEHHVPFAGTLGAWRLDVARAERDGGVVLPAGAVVRGRRPGDRIQPRGMRGHKKLQDYYVDRKVPRRERAAAPVIAVGGEVLWTPFGSAARCDEGEPYAVRSVRAR